MIDNTFVSQTSIEAGESIDTRIDVRQLDRPVSLAIGIDRAGLQQQPSQIPTPTPDTRLKEEVKDPNGRVVSTSEFGDSFFTTFNPEVTGVYTVTVSNLGISPVTVSGAFGYIPFIGSDGNFPVDGMMGGKWGLGMIIAGGALASIGLVTLIVGAVITVADSRRQSSTTTTTTTTEGGITYRKD
jgi:uncharacterized membrane protein